MVWFTRKPINAAFGTVSCKTSNCFAVNVPTKKVTPVMLLPGRLRLATRPNLIGSPPISKTIGIVVVADLAAEAEVMPPIEMITVTSRRTNSFGRRFDELWHQRLQAPAIARNDPPPRGIRMRRSVPRRSPLPSGPAELQPPRKASDCADPRAKEPNDRHRWLLRACRVTPGCRRRAAKKRDQVPPPHKDSLQADDCTLPHRC